MTTPTTHRPTSAAQLFLTPGFTLGVTGHRKLDAPVLHAYEHLIGLWLDKIRPAKVISGMALGIDTLAAEAAIARGIRLHAMVPGSWQASQWKSVDQERWANLLAHDLTEVTIVDPRPLPENPTQRRARVISTLMKRNEWIVKNSTMLLACWDGRRGGGTTQAIRQAANHHVPVLRLCPGTQGRLAMDSPQIHRMLEQHHEIGPITAGTALGQRLPGLVTA